MISRAAHSFSLACMVMACGSLAWPQATPPPTAAAIPQPAAAAVPTTQQDYLYHWRRSTIALGQIFTADGKPPRFVTSGSAVVVALDEKHVCLLTAKHMFYKPDAGYLPTQISMRPSQEGKGDGGDLGAVIKLVVNGMQTWRTTTEPSDLAVIPLPDLSQYKNLHAISIREFAGADDIYQGATVLVMGYPGILGETYQTSPIARNGIISWVNPDGVNTKPFLIDANIFSGNSGGPVFKAEDGKSRTGLIRLGGGYSFIGIVSEDAQEYSDVYLADKSTFVSSLKITDPITQKTGTLLAQVKNIGGIGVIEPAELVRRLLEDAFGLPRYSLSPPNLSPNYK